VYVAFGVTGVQDMVAISSARRRGARRSPPAKRSPHILTCGPPVVEKPTGDEKLPGLIARTPEEARKAFDDLWNLDVDFIKVLSGLSRDAYFALAEQSRHWNVPLRGHIPRGRHRARSCRSAPEQSGAFVRRSGRVLSEGGDLDERKTVELFEKSALVGTRHSPTLLAVAPHGSPRRRGAKNDARLKYVPESIRKSWPDPRTTQKNGPAKHARSGRRKWSGSIASPLWRNAPRSNYWLVPIPEIRTLFRAQVYTTNWSNWSAQVSPRARRSKPPRSLRPHARVGRSDGYHRERQGRGSGAAGSHPIEDIRNTRRIAAVFARGKHFSRKDLDEILAAVH